MMEIYCFKTDIFDIHIEYNTYYKQSDMNMSKFINSFTKFINSFKWNHTSIWLENTVLFFPLFPYLGFRPISEYSRLNIILCNHPCVYWFFSILFFIIEFCFVCSSITMVLRKKVPILIKHFLC